MFRVLDGNKKYLLAPYQRPGADSRVEARHVYILADAWRHPHEQLQLPAGGGWKEEGAELQGLDGYTFTLRLENAYIQEHR